MENIYNIPIIIASILVTLIGLAFVGYFMQIKNSHQTHKTTNLFQWLKPTLKSAIKPLSAIIVLYAIYISYFAVLALGDLPTDNFSTDVITAFLNVGLILNLFWLIIRLSQTVTMQLHQWSIENEHKVGIIIFPLVNRSLKAITVLILINLLLPYFPIPDQYLPIAEKTATLLLIAAITWIMLQIVNAFEQYILKTYQLQTNASVKTRKIYTQITVLKKIVFTIIIVVAVAIALMTFDRVRELGATLLGTAGIIAAIGTFAGQKTLASMFSGLQIALTQPIKINDVIVVENELGSVEEISLSYVIIRLWDLRRLVVPIGYFIDKPFQNWTRESQELLGTIFLYTDYSLPLEGLREKLQDILYNSPLWNQKVGALQVTDCKEKTMELRILVSANDAANLFDLRCHVREQLIAYIRDQYPEFLPKLRIETNTDE